MILNKFAATLGLSFLAATTATSALADPAENCGVVKQTFVANNGNRWTEPVVACREKSDGVWVNRDMQRHITAGAGTKDEVNAGFGVLNGIVTTYIINRVESAVEVESCEDTARILRFWTSNKEATDLLKELISEAAAKEGYSEDSAANFLTAYLETQNGATMECESKGFVPVPVLAPSAK